MPYRVVPFDHIEDPVLNRVFEHVNAYLHDVYSMLTIDPGQSRLGGCNFSMALVMFCVIDGLARDVYPTMKVPDQGRRFCQLIREKLPWETVDDGWIEKNRAANVFYTDIRNPITHELGQDKITSVRPEDYLESAVVRSRKGRNLSADEIDALPVWDKQWPVLTSVTKTNGRSRYVLDCGALYWAIKRMVTEFLQNEDLLNAAIHERNTYDANLGHFHIGKIHDKVSRWANLQREISRVWIFGSRVKGVNRIGSDLNLAVELVESLQAASINDWKAISGDWRRELGRLMRLPVDVRLYHQNLHPEVCQYVSSGSRLCFDRITKKMV